MRYVCLLLPNSIVWAATPGLGAACLCRVLPVTLVPAVSQLLGTFSRYPPHDKRPLFIGMPESSASSSTEKDEVLVVGCSHSSVEAIVKRAPGVARHKIHLVGGVILENW
jgi:hypothetical protein